MKQTDTSRNAEGACVECAGEFTRQDWMAANHGELKPLANTVKAPKGHTDAWGEPIRIWSHGLLEARFAAREDAATIYLNGHNVGELVARGLGENWVFRVGSTHSCEPNVAEALREADVEHVAEGFFRFSRAAGAGGNEAVEDFVEEHGREPEDREWDEVTEAGTEAHLASRPNTAGDFAMAYGEFVQYIEDRA